MRGVGWLDDVRVKSMVSLDGYKDKGMVEVEHIVYGGVCDGVCDGVCLCVAVMYLPHPPHPTPAPPTLPPPPPPYTHTHTRIWRS